MYDGRYMEFLRLTNVNVDRVDSSKSVNRFDHSESSGNVPMNAPICPSKAPFSEMF